MYKCTNIPKLLRGVIFKIQPLRNPSIFNNKICVPISKVLLKGMSNHPNLEIFRTSSKIWQIRIFFFKIQNFMWEKIVAGGINGLCINKDFDEKKIPKFQNFHIKNGSSVKWKKKIKTLSAHRFLKVELVPKFRKFLNVWHIQNLEQPFLIWACNCLVKFWRSPKNFKIQKILGENSLVI